MAFAGAAAASPAQARDYCPTRPSLGQSACVLDTGRVAVETALVDWERDRSEDDRTDTLLLADTLLRVGVTDTAELQLDWQPYGRKVSHDLMTGGRAARDRVGDLSIGSRINLRNPDGSGFSWGLQPSVTLPTGRRPIGGGDWGASLIVPVSVEIAPGASLQASPEVAAAVNESGDGQHLAYGTIVGLELGLSETLTTSIEAGVRREDDPLEAATEWRAAASVGWMASDDLQLDMGTAVGLNATTPDVRLYAGVSRRF